MDYQSPVNIKQIKAYNAAIKKTRTQKNIDFLTLILLILGIIVVIESISFLVYGMEQAKIQYYWSNRIGILQKITHYKK